jgi:hypothetical protein
MVNQSFPVRPVGCGGSDENEKHVKVVKYVLHMLFVPCRLCRDSILAADADWSPAPLRIPR